MAELKPRTVDHQYFVRASPEVVFDAITNPQTLVKWLADRAELLPKVGAPYRLGWTGGPTHTGTVVAYAPGKHIALGWSWPGASLEGTVFKLSVEPQGDGTLLRVEHTGFPATEEGSDLYAASEWGWTYFAMNLKSVLETGHDLRSSSDG